MSNTRVLEREPELQAQGGQAPPATPRRTALGTDEPEKRRCSFCGHTRTEHFGSQCRGETASPLGCICTTYVPKASR